MTSSSSCEAFSNDIPLYLTGDLDDGAAAHLRAHLGTCPGCEKTLAEEQHVLTLLRGLDTEDVGSDLPDGFFEQRVAPHLRPRRWPALLRAAALIAVFLSGMAVQRSWSGESQQPPTNGASELYRIYGAEAGRGNDLSRMLVALGTLRKEQQ